MNGCASVEMPETGLLLGQAKLVLVASAFRSSKPCLASTSLYIFLPSLGQSIHSQYVRCTPCYEWPLYHQLSILHLAKTHGRISISACQEASPKAILDCWCLYHISSSPEPKVINSTDHAPRSLRLMALNVNCGFIVDWKPILTHATFGCKTSACCF